MLERVLERVLVTSERVLERVSVRERVLEREC